MLARTPATLAENLRGSAFMVAGMFGFAVNDTIAKAFGGQLGVSQFICLRGLIATALVFLLARYMGQMRGLALMMDPKILARAASEAVATVLFITALFHIPIANVSAVMQALPLALTLCAAYFLGEKVGWRRLSAILIGMFGVLVIIRPGLAGFSVYSVYVVGSVAACVVRDLITRRLGGEIPALFISFVTALFVTLTGAAMAPFSEWQPVTLTHVGLMTGSALFLLMGYYFVVVSMRVGDIGFVSPFRYSVLLFSILGGILVYGEIPDAMTGLGAAIVVATGVYTLYRERIVARRPIAQLPTRP
jgi:drug/metabolite transporter (DMT)-like permease